MTTADAAPRDSAVEDGPAILAEVLAAAPAPPAAAARGVAAHLPLLRWLVGELRPRRAALAVGAGERALRDAAPEVAWLRLEAGALDLLVGDPAAMDPAGWPALLAPGGVLVRLGAPADAGTAAAAAAVLEHGGGLALACPAGPSPPPLERLAAALADPAAGAALRAGLARLADWTAAEAGRVDELVVLTTVAEAARLAAEAADARADAAEAALREVAAERDALLGSTSWRLTAPLRRAVLTLRR